MLPFPTRRPPSMRLLLFARAPELGLVKSRLAAEIGRERALELYQAMLRDLLTALGPSSEDLEIEVLWTGSSGVTGEQLRRTFGEFPLARQAGSDLGQRLAIAFAERLFFHRTDKVIAIGSDDPELTRRAVELAFSLLDSCEWVIGPATDGGYYLIGCRADSYRAEVFDEIEWGSSGVLEATMIKVRGLGFTLALLPEHSDIDLVSDLRSFHERIPPHAAGIGMVLESWGWSR